MSARSQLTVQLVQDTGEFGALREPWNELLTRSATDNVFLRWEWLWAWWTVYREPGDLLSIALVRRGPELVGIAPLYRRTRIRAGWLPVRVLMFLGTHPGCVTSEYMDLIYPSDTEAVVGAVVEAFAREDGWDEMALQSVDTASRTLPALADAGRRVNGAWFVERRVECPYIKLPHTIEEFSKQCSPSLRYNIRRGRARLAGYRDVVFRRTTTPDELDADFAEMVRLHQRRWESRAQAGSFAAEPFARFHKAVMADMLRDGSLELRFLSIDGRNVAVLYNIKYKNKIYFYQSGLDTSFDRKLSPGLLLHSHSIEQAIADHLDEYDFLMQGDRDSYKQRWTKDCRYVCDAYLTRGGLTKWATSLYHTAKVCYRALHGWGHG